MNKILVIEDDKIKIERLNVFFSSEEIIIKESFQSGLSEIKNNMQAYDFLILDMTIPLWEKGNNDLGGNYEQFGGEKILREMKRRKLFLPTILFTMFDIFPTKDGNIAFCEVNSVFEKEFSDFYIGAVFYNSNEDNWKLEMTTLISKIKI
jgi:hypothetical protein